MQPDSEEYVDTVIPYGESWTFTGIAGTVDGGEAKCEIQMKLSMDGGETWLNPLQPDIDWFFKAHLGGNKFSEDFGVGCPLINGLPDDKMVIRAIVKNYDTEPHEFIVRLYGFK